MEIGILFFFFFQSNHAEVHTFPITSEFLDNESFLTCLGLGFHHSLSLQSLDPQGFLVLKVDENTSHPSGIKIMVGEQPLRQESIWSWIKMTQYLLRHRASPGTSSTTSHLTPCITAGPLTFSPVTSSNLLLVII